MHTHKLCWLVLQITRRCNLACKYCAYSGNFYDFLPHDAVDMAVDTAFKGIVFFLEHADPQEELRISFYGGEPLLCFNTLQKLVSYARKQQEKMGLPPIQFLISSNGTTITTSIAQWLAQNPDITIFITLNGFKHDKYRIYRDGKGSLSCIIDNIDNLCNMFNSVWENQVQFISNIYSLTELPSLKTFFKKDNCNDDNIFLHFAKEYLTSKDVFLEDLFKRDFSRINDRPIFNTDKNFMASCMPADSRLFIRTDGSFNICEKTSDHICIGNLEYGFNGKIVETLCSRLLSIVKKKCRFCWAQRICNICFAELLINKHSGKFELPDEFCKKSKHKAFLFLKAYCENKVYPNLKINVEDKEVREHFF